MNQEETWSLYQQGRDAWNAWANDMLAQRRALEESGEWTGEAGQKWREQAEADFREREFEDAADFRDFIFSGDARFDGARFSGDAGFGGAGFSGNAGFDGARFSGGAGFVGARFSGAAWFDDARFSDVAGFGGARFSDGAWFIGARFRGDAWFGGAGFSGDAWFGGARFSGDAGFGGATFKRTATFDRAFFRAAADFRGLAGGIAFSLADARFLAVPDFIQAHFEEGPRLDDTEVEPRGLLASLRQVKARFKSRGDTPRRQAWREIWNGGHQADEHVALQLRHLFIGDRDRAARWRALRRLATQGHDHAREMDFFAGEIVASRWAVNGFFSFTLWLGYLYQVLSNFGRSFLLPILWWCLATATWTCWYLQAHLAAAHKALPVMTSLWHWLRGAPPAPACLVGEGDPWWMALQLSLRKGLIFVGIDATEKLNQIHACLYGVHNPSVLEPRVLRPDYSPVIPDSVALLGLAQTLVSAVLIFLFLLAVRNHFRIR